MPRPPTLESALLRLIDLFAFSTHSNAARRRFETATGIMLPRSGIETLDILARDPRTASELASAMRTDPTQSSRRVSGLVRQGLIAKQRREGDKRQVLLTLTDMGQHVVHRWQISWQTEIRRPLDSWSVEDVNALADWLSCACRRLTPTLASHVDTDLITPGHTRAFDPPSAPRPEVAHCVAVIADLVYLIGRTDFDEALHAAEIDLPSTQYFVLRDIEMLGPTTVSALADRLDLEQSAASRAVAALHGESLIHRTTDNADGRSRQLTVTDTGEKSLRKARRARLSGVRRLFADLDSAEHTRYAELTMRYLDDLLATADVAAGRYL